jgi:hypothetical protein
VPCAVRGFVGCGCVFCACTDLRIMTSGLAEAYVAQGLEFVKRMMGVHHLTLGQVCTPQCCNGI